MKNVLLTGASGFLGKIVHRVLEEQGRNVIGIGRAAQTLNIDITNPFDIPPPIATDIDVVVHAAGKAHSVPKSKEEEEAFFMVNFEGTKNLCQALDKLAAKPKSFIFISTVSVYGVDQGINIHEEFPLNGESPYAKSKILAERYLQGWSTENKVVLGILRLPLIVGPEPLGNLGAMIKGIKSGKYLSIGNAEAKKSVVWAEDVANIIPKIAEEGGIYHLTDGYHPSFGELENIIAASFHKQPPLRIPLSLAKIMASLGDILGAKAPINTNKLTKITSTLTFDDRKARHALGWNPTKVLEKLSLGKNCLSQDG